MSVLYFNIFNRETQDSANAARAPAQEAPAGNLAGRTLEALTQSSCGILGGLKGVAMGALNGIGSAASYASRTYTEYMDPQIESAKSNILAHTRDQIRPLNALSENKTYITENTSIEDLNSFSTSLDEQIEELQDEMDEISNPFQDASELDTSGLEDFEVVGSGDEEMELEGILDEDQLDQTLKLQDKIDKLSELKSHIQTLVQKKEELQLMRTGNYAIAAGLRRGVQVGSLAHMAATNQITPQLDSIAQSFDVRALLEDENGIAPANLFDFLLPEPDSIIGQVASPIIREIQGELSWATEGAHLQEVASQVTESIQEFVVQSTQNPETQAAFQKFSLAAQKLTAFGAKTKLEEEIDLLENHYTSGTEAALTKAQAQLTQLNAMIEGSFPDETLETVQELFEFAQLEYETCLLGGELLDDKVSAAQDAALNNLTSFLLKDVSQNTNIFLKTLKQIIYWVVFKLVHLVVKDLVHNSVDAKMVEELAASMKAKIGALINDPNYAPYIQGPQRKLLPALIESQVKALIPHLLADVPQRLANYKEAHRDLPMEITERLTEQNAVQFQGALTATADSILDLVTGGSTGATVTGSSFIDGSLVSIGRGRARQMIHEADFSGPLSRIGANIHTWIGQSPTANHPLETEPAADTPTTD